MGHAGYTPEHDDYQIYDADDSTAKAALNTKPTIAPTETMVIHACILETGGDSATANKPLQIEYSDDESTWYTLGAPSATDKLFRWHSNPTLTEHATTSSKLACQTQAGTVHELTCAAGWNHTAAQHIESSICIEGYNPVANTTYYFRFVVDSVAIPKGSGKSFPQVLIEAGETTAYKDITLKTSLESDLTYKDITLKITLDSLDFKDIALKTSFSIAPSLAYKDITLKTSITSALTYKDITLKTTLESAPTYKDITVKTTLESAPTYKDITLKTTLESIPTYKDIAFKTSLDSLDYKDIVIKTSFDAAPLLDFKDIAIKVSFELGEVMDYKDITLKTTLESALTYKDVAIKTSLDLFEYTEYKDITLKTTLDSLDYKDIALKTTLESIDIYKDITVKTTLESINIYKDITVKTTLESALTYKDILLKASFRLSESIGYKDISIKATIFGKGFQDINIRVSLEAIPKEIINFTSEITQIEDLVSAITQTENFIANINL